MVRGSIDCCARTLFWPVLGCLGADVGLGQGGNRPLRALVWPGMGELKLGRLLNVLLIVYSTVERQIQRLLRW
jgi:hypothetical protein